MKTVINILTFASFIFLIIFLYQYDYVKISNLSLNYTDLFVSIVLMLTTISVSTITWWLALADYGIDVPISASIISQSRSILAKYIPGKIWVLFGRAAYISQFGHKLSLTSFVSVKLQILTMCVGLSFGILPLLFYKELSAYQLLFGSVLIILVLVLVSEKLQNKVLHVFTKITRSKIIFPQLLKNQLWWAKAIIFCQYFGYTSSFYFLVRSIFPEASFISGLAFPLAINFGLLIIFIPGGLGIREGIIVWFLTLQGIPLATAVTVSVAARIWFTFGEVFLFVLGWIFEKSIKIHPLESNPQ
jgi:uncharacterized membrane protein YbhN (UPF0104 family)